MNFQEIYDGIVQAFQIGGYTMYPILFCFCLLMAFSLERFSQLYLRLSIDGRGFMYELQKYVTANDIESAVRLCNGASSAALPRVVKAGLMRSSKDDAHIQTALEAACLEQLPKLEKRLGYMALIANVSTLLGLLGTINGLIKAFRAISSVDPAQRQAILGRGISEAMYATAFGLVTAIMAMVLHSIFTAKAQKISDEVEEFSMKLLDLLQNRRNRVTSG